MQRAKTRRQYAFSSTNNALIGCVACKLHEALASAHSDGGIFGGGRLLTVMKLEPPLVRKYNASLLILTLTLIRGRGMPRNLAP